MMNHRFGLRGRPGVALSENITVVLLMIFVGVGLVTVFGQNIARRFQGVTTGLDEGKPIAKTALTGPQNRAEIGAPGNAPVVSGPLPAVAAPANAAAGANPGYGGANARTPDRTEANSGITLANPRGWDPRAMLAGMTQIDQNLVHTTNFDPMRCACASALASRIMSGPDAVDRMLADLMLRAQNGTLPNSSAGPPPMIGGMPRDQYIAQLGTLRDRLAGQALNHADLGLMQDLLYRGHSIVPGVQGTYFYTGGGAQNYQQIMTLGNGVDPAGATIGAPNAGNNQATTVNQAQLATNMTNLTPGESMTLGIGAPGHFIVVGRDNQGRPYLYDPWPFVGTGGNPAPPQLTYDPAVLDWYMNNQMPPGGFIQYSPVRH